MVGSSGRDNSLRHLGGDERKELGEDYSNLASFPKSSSTFHSDNNDQGIFEEGFTPSRHLLFEEVTELNGTGCSLTTTLRTGYRGWNTASGIMFTVQPSKDIELLTIEIPTFEDYSSDPSSAKNIQVYYRLGGFSGVMNNPSAWTSIADTNAQFVAPLPLSDSSSQTDQDMGVIVPANKFKKTTLKQGEIYSIYIVGGPSTQNPKQTLLKLKPGDGLVGDKSTGNDAIEIHTGVRLKGEPFPMLFTDPADFNGVLHYRSTTSCEDHSLFANTQVFLLFAVNSDPNSNALGSLRGAVEETISEWMDTNESLLRFANEDMLKLDGIGTHFRGRSEKCPDDFESCSLISTTLNFKHFHNLDQGKLQMEILRRHEDLDATVSSYVSSNTNPIDTVYVGNPLSKVEFAITLTGVPNGELMNNVQKRYFGDVTVNFLRQHIKTKVFDVVVNDALPEYLVVEDGESPSSRRRSRNLGSTPTLRGTRGLQSSGSKIKIIAEVAAEGTVPEVRNAVLEGMGNNVEEFTMELISHQFRPIDNNQGNFFDSLTGAQVKPYVPPTVAQDVDETTPGTPTIPGTGIESSRPVKSQGSAYVIVCILLIFFSFFWICYRIYMDCFHSPFEEPLKLSKTNKKDKKKKGKRRGKRRGKNNDIDEFKDEEESENNGTGKSSIFGLLKGPSGSSSTSYSPRTPSTSASSKSSHGTRNQTSIHRVRSSDDASKSSSKKDLDDADSFGNDSCSLGDVESSDDESVGKSAPQRSSSGPTRGKLKPSKSMPVQKRDKPNIDAKKPRKPVTKSPKAPQRTPRRSPSGDPKRGRLRATKSMPVQKRPKSSEGISDTRKSTSKIPKGSQRSTSRRSASGEGPKRGKLTATKSMPVQKREHSSHDAKKKKKKSPTTKSAKDEIPNFPKRGKLTPSKSLPVEKRKVKRNKSMPLTERKLELESKLAVKKRLQEDSSKDTKPIMPANLKKRLETRSSHSESKKLDRLSTHSDSKKLDHRSWHPESKKLESRSSHSYNKKLEPRSTHSTTKKKKAAEKKRGIKASRSMPLERRKKPESEKIIKLSDMYHDSTSDSDISDSSNDEMPSSIKSQTSWKSETPKSSDSRRSYGKAGKIQFGASNGGLADVAE